MCEALKICLNLDFSATERPKDQSVLIVLNKEMFSALFILAMFAVTVISQSETNKCLDWYKDDRKFKLSSRNSKKQRPSCQPVSHVATPPMSMYAEERR